MFKTKRSTNLAWLVGSLLLLQGCGDSYPEIGKFQGSQFESAKNLSQYSTVYSLDQSSFVDWKEARSDLQDLSKLSESDLLSLQKKFAKSPLIQKAFASKPLLVNESLDLNDVVNQEYGQITEQSEQVKSNLAKIEEAIAALNTKREKAEAAKIELTRIKNEFEAEENKLLNNFNTLKAQSAQIFKQFTKNDIGGRYEPTKIVEDSKPFDYVTYKEASGLSCKDYTISKNKWQKKRYQTYIYASPIKLGDKAYCPVFKTLGGKEAQRNAILAKLSDTDKSVLQQAATANVIYKKSKSDLRSKQRDVARNNPAIYETSKSFSYKEERELSKLVQATEQGKQKIAMLAQTTKEDIKANKVKQLTALLTRAKNYYLFESLQNQLEKESIIQPDGTFTLKSGEDFYLVEIDLSSKQDPSGAQYALIRMEQFKNKELVDLSSNEFFSFKDLSNITL